MRIAAEHLVAGYPHELAAEGQRSGDPAEWSPDLLKEIARQSVQDVEEGVEIKDVVKP